MDNQQPRGAAPRRTYAGIDGIKGLALVAIIVYHFNAAVLPGGFVGVDVFLTVSGFLAGTGLVRSLLRSGTIDIRSYLARRARRLVPALAAMVPVAVLVAAATNPDLLVNVLGQVLSGLTFSFNWFAILSNASYFDAMNPQLFQHLWFIGILVQCYVVVPLVVRALWGRLGFRGTLRVLVGLAALSFLAMGVLYDPDSPTRVYEGTDTHMGGFLLGMALAWGLEWMLRGDGARVGATFAKAMPYVAFGSLVVIVCLAVGLGQGPETFRGGVAAASVCCVLLILGTIPKGSWMQGLFEMPPLAFLGRYSYGFYLWHWPLWLVISTSVPGWPPVVTALVTLAATAVVSLASWHLVEQPLSAGELLRGGSGEGRRQAAGTAGHGDHEAGAGKRPAATAAAAAVGGAGASEDSPAHPAAGAPRHAAGSSQPALTRLRPQLMATGVVLAACYVGCFVAIANAPAKTRMQVQLEQMQADQDAQRQAAADVEARLSALQVGDGDLPSGEAMTAIGDSVMLFSANEIRSAFPGIYLDAKSARTFSTGMEIVSGMASSGELRPWVLLGLASNSTIDEDGLDQARSTLGDDRMMLLVGAHGPAAKYPRYPEMNKLLKDYAASHSGNTIFVDWDAAISQHPDLLYDDGVHAQESAGGKVYAQAVADAIRQWVAAQRASAA